MAENWVVGVGVGAAGVGEGRVLKNSPGRLILNEKFTERIATPIRITFIIISDTRRNDVVALRLHLVLVGSSDVMDKRIIESIKRTKLIKMVNVFMIEFEISPVEGVLTVYTDARAPAIVKPARKDVMDP